MAEQCDNCNFYRIRNYGPKTVGECRVAEPSGTIGFWPQVKVDDWCGKYEIVQRSEADAVR